MVALHATRSCVVGVFLTPLLTSFHIPFFKQLTRHHRCSGFLPECLIPSYLTCRFSIDSKYRLSRIGERYTQKSYQAKFHVTSSCEVQPWNLTSTYKLLNNNSYPKRIDRRLGQTPNSAFDLSIKLPQRGSTGASVSPNATFNSKTSTDLLIANA